MPWIKDSSTTRSLVEQYGIIEKQAKSGIAGIRAHQMDYETDSLKGVLDLVERLDDLIVAYVRSLFDRSGCDLNSGRY